MAKIDNILKELFKKSGFRYQGLTEAKFLKYHTNILEERLKSHPTNRILFDNNKKSMAMGLFEYLPWDSDIFKMKMGRLEYFTYAGGCRKAMREKIVKEIFSLSKRAKLDFLSAKVNIGDSQGAQVLENFGFILVDVLINFAIVTKDLSINEVNGHIRAYKSKDFLQIIRVARDSFVYNRFFNDDRLDKRYVKNLYQKWVEQACLINPCDVLIWEDAGKVLGFIICKVDKLSKKIFDFSVGEVDLIAVGLAEKGKGIGTELVKAGLNKFKKDKIDLVEVRTQSANIMGINSFMKAGFRRYNAGLVLPAGLVFHKWFN